MFGNHLTTNFLQNAPVKKFKNRSIFGKHTDKTLWLTFWAILYSLAVLDRIYLALALLLGYMCLTGVLGNPTIRSSLCGSSE